jgi:uncharacterized delta-60 repeat protein
MGRLGVTVFLVVVLLPVGCDSSRRSTKPHRLQGDRVFAAQRLVVRPDGRILLAGLIRGGRSEDDWCRGSSRREFGTVHLSAAGRLIGVYSVPEAEVEGCPIELRRAALDGEEGLQVGGVVERPPDPLDEGGPGPVESTLFARFEPEGPLDESFGHEGTLVQPPPNQEPESVAEGPGFAVAGMPGGGRAVLEEDPETGRVSLVRYDGSWHRVKSFDRGGSAPVPAIPAQAGLDETDTIWDLILDRKRGFYGFAGYLTDSGTAEYVLFRHRPDGRPDVSFGEGGRVLLRPPNAEFYATTQVALRPDGEVVATGVRDHGRTVYVLRVTPDGGHDGAFGRSGVVELEAAPRPSSRTDAYTDPFAAVAVQPDGKVVVAASSSSGGTTVFRLLPDGRVDSGFGRAGRVVIGKV